MGFGRDEGEEEEWEVLEGLNALTGIDGIWTLRQRTPPPKYDGYVLMPLRALMGFGLIFRSGLLSGQDNWS